MSAPSPAFFDVKKLQHINADYIRRHLDSERPSLPDDPNSRPARKGLDGPRSGVDEENSYRPTITS